MIDLYIFAIIIIVANSVKPFEKVKWIHTRGKRESAQRPFVLIPLTGSAKGVTITKLQTPIGNQKWDKKNRTWFDIWGHIFAGVCIA